MFNILHLITFGLLNLIIGLVAGIIIESLDQPRSKKIFYVFFAIGILLLFLGIIFDALKIY